MDNWTKYWDDQYWEFYKSDRSQHFADKDAWIEQRLGGIVDSTILALSPDKDPLWAPGDILDFGCGNGQFHKFLTRHINDDYLGVDTSERAIQVAREHSEESWGIFFDTIDPYPAPLPFGDGVFGVIFTWTVLQHMPEDMRTFYIKELKRVMKPGGFYIGNEMMGPTLGVEQSLDQPSRYNPQRWINEWKPLKMSIHPSAYEYHDDLWIGLP